MRIGGRLRLTPVAVHVVSWETGGGIAATGMGGRAIRLSPASTPAMVATAATAAPSPPPPYAATARTRLSRVHARGSVVIAGTVSKALRCGHAVLPGWTIPGRRRQHPRPGGGHAPGAAAHDHGRAARHGAGQDRVLQPR